MAKQIGIHQIKGKVGERSYYRTKGVELGISRSINQGLSARVKNGEEYVNTRLNNAEFKNANAIASAAFDSVNTRKRGMMRNFAVAEMTKAALADIKLGAGDWGARHPLTELDVLIVDMLENHAKGGAYQGEYGDFGFNAMTGLGVAELNVNIPVDKQVELNALGIDALQIVISKCLAGEVDVDGAPRLYSGHQIIPVAPVALSATTDITVQQNLDFSTPINVGMSQGGYTAAIGDPKHGFFAVITIVPMRTENGKRYVLQEACTYAAFALGQIPE